MHEYGSLVWNIFSGEHGSSETHMEAQIACLVGLYGFFFVVLDCWFFLALGAEWEIRCEGDGISVCF